MSGVPGRSTLWSLNLSPRACAHFLTRSSGAVCFPPTRDINHDRLSGLSLSTIPLRRLARCCAGFVANHGEDCSRNNRGHAVADHPKAMPDGWVKFEIVVEAL